MQPLSIERDVRRNGIRMGFTVVPFGQGFKDMRPPTKEFYHLMMEGRIIHGGNPIMALDRCIRHEKQGSVYDERGLLVF